MLEKWFKLSAQGTTPRREVVAGLTTFAAMAYILTVNPAILSATGMEPAGLVTVTALAAALGTLFMALLTNYPIALAPGMGLNAFFAYTVVLGMGVPWEAALGLVFWNGVLFLGLSVTGVRGMIAEAIPDNLKIGVQAGIGLFIAFIGLKNSGIIVANPATFVTLGDLSQPQPLLALLGLVVAVGLVFWRVPGAILLAILGITVIGFFVPTGTSETGQATFLTARPEALISPPAGIGQTFFALDLLYPFKNFGQAWAIILALLFVDMFDTIGTLLGVSRRAGLTDAEGRLPRIGRALSADAAATIAGASLGTSTTTAYIESATGVQAGGRTGLTGVVVAGCFLLALIFTPLILIVPTVATAPALIMVGIFMTQGLKHLDFDDLLLVAPAFVTMLTMPLAFSISEGIGLGFITHVGLQLVAGRARRVSWLTYLLAALFLAHYIWG